MNRYKLENDIAKLMAENLVESSTLGRPILMEHHLDSIAEKVVNFIIANTMLCEVTCPHCGGDGFTAEHDPCDPHEGGMCSNCPIQVQCEPCWGRGKLMICVQGEGK